MEIEQMRIRMAEMAAEIERLTSENAKTENNLTWVIDELKAENARLQAVIDAANAQEPVGYVVIGQGISLYKTSKDEAEYQANALEWRDEKEPAIHPVYVRPIPAQQSQDYAALKKWYVNLTNADDVIDGENVNGKHCTGAMLDELERILEQQSQAVAVPDEETNFCALKSITDSQVNAVARAFWRRIHPYRNDYGIELPKPLPVEFMAHMATALSWVDKQPSPRITEQDALEIAKSVQSFVAVLGSDYSETWLNQLGRALLDKLNGAKHV